MTGSRPEATMRAHTIRVNTARMRSSRTSYEQFLSGALAAALSCVVACDGGDGGDDGDGTTEGGGSGGDGACNPDEWVDWEGMTYTESEGTDESFEDCDPQVGVIAFYEDESIIGDTLESVSMVLQWGKVPAGNTWNVFTLRIGGPGTPMEAGVAYPMSDTESYIEVIDTGPGDTLRFCQTEAGEAVVDVLGANGEPVSGSYTVTAWNDKSDATCPAVPATGSFYGVRNN
jgi:hypothetical protein